MLSVKPPLEADWLLPTGLLGIAGAVLMLAGDALLYAHWNGMPAVSANVEQAVSARKAILAATNDDLFWTSVLGPLASFLYLGGAFHVYLRTRESWPRCAKLAALLLALVVIMGGAYHAMWSQFGFALKYANGHTDTADLLLPMAANMRFMESANAIPGIIWMLLLFAIVGSGRSSYPTWTVAVNPIFWFGLGTTLLTPYAASAPVPAGALLLGGLYNTLMMIFFVVSVLTIPRRARSPARPLRHTATDH